MKKPKLTKYPDGTKFWFINRKLHREDGPAIEYPDGTKEWFLNGKRLFEKQFKIYRRLMNSKHQKILHLRF